MGKTNTHRSETIVKFPVSTVPASDTNYTVDLPAGTYHVAMSVKSNVTGTSTTLALIPFVDVAQTQINNLAFRMVEPNDTSVITLLTLPAGAAGRYVSLLGSALTLPMPTYVVVPHGLRLAVVKGGATTGETLEVTITASRVA